MVAGRVLTVPPQANGGSQLTHSQQRKLKKELKRAADKAKRNAGT
jgi:hypothetical protein